MRFTLAVLITLLFNYLAGLILPWWIIAVVGLMVGYLVPLSPSKSFLAGFLACFILWAGLAFYLDLANDHILAKRIGALFTLNEPFLMILITGIIGGLVTGMASLTGSLLRKSVKPASAA
ncbi:MAG: hypothetical protein EOO04_29920 [Chitinophagaceae bacterium]|nr:MAG: hypothetical protein EOO04_29920 [Chitinophagaceae bacterium]